MVTFSTSWIRKSRSQTVLSENTLFRQRRTNWWFALKAIYLVFNIYNTDKDDVKDWSVVISICSIWQISSANSALCYVAVVTTRKLSLFFKPSWNSVSSDQLFLVPAPLTKTPSISCPFIGTAVRQNLAKTLAMAGQIGLKVEVNRPLVSFGTAKVWSIHFIWIG